MVDADYCKKVIVFYSSELIIRIFKTLFLLRLHKVSRSDVDFTGVTARSTCTTDITDCSVSSHSITKREKKHLRVTIIPYLQLQQLCSGLLLSQHRLLFSLYLTDSPCALLRQKHSYTMGPEIKSSSLRNGSQFVTP